MKRNQISLLSSFVFVSNARLLSSCFARRSSRYLKMPLNKYSGMHDFKSVCLNNYFGKRRETSKVIQTDFLLDNKIVSYLRMFFVNCVSSTLFFCRKIFLFSCSDFHGCYTSQYTK